MFNWKLDNEKIYKRVYLLYFRYISHEKRKIVLSRKGAFPSINEVLGK